MICGLNNGKGKSQNIQPRKALTGFQKGAKHPLPFQNTIPTICLPKQSLHGYTVQKDSHE